MSLPFVARQRESPGATHRILVLNDDLQIRLIGSAALHTLLASLHILPDLVVVPVTTTRMDFMHA